MKHYSKKQLNAISRAKSAKQRMIEEEFLKCVGQFEEYQQQSKYLTMRGFINHLMKTFVSRFIIKSKSNTERYKRSNINLQEYKLMQLELIDLATMTDNIDDYTKIANAIIGDCKSVGVNL